MKKVFLLSSILTILCSLGYAQVIEVTPVEFDTSGTPDDNDIGYALHITNISGDSLYLYWGKRLNGAPAEWWSWVCDPNGCYLPDAQSCPLNRPNRMGAGDVIEISVHVNPRNVAGVGEFTLNLLDSLANPFETVIGTFTVLGTATSDGFSKSLTLSPNPAGDYFTMDIAGSTTCTLFDLNGKQIGQHHVEPGEIISTEGLPAGCYIVSLADATNHRRFSRLMIQR